MSDEKITCPKWADGETIDEANCRLRIETQFGLGGLSCGECPVFSSYRTASLKKALAELDEDLSADAPRAWLAYQAGWPAGEIAAELGCTEGEALALIMRFGDRPVEDGRRLLQ